MLFPSSWAQAQQGRWRPVAVRSGGIYNRFGARVQIDGWGHSHVVWASQASWASRADWNSDKGANAGIQLFYSNDATGVFCAPIQATDTLTGTVYAPDLNSTPWDFLVDRLGTIHLLYIANNQGYPRLYYTSNVGHMFGRPEELVGLPGNGPLSFDMAVDSNGVAHVIWLESTSQQKTIYHWSTADFQTEEVTSFQCSGNCVVGHPSIAIGRDHRAVVAVRNVVGGRGSLYLIQQKAGGDFDQRHWLQTMPFGSALDRDTTNGVRVKLALDNDGGMHLVMPYISGPATAPNSLLYVYADSTRLDSQGSSANATYLGDARPLTQPLQGVPLDFDLAFNASNRVSVAWTVTPSAKPTRVGYAELQKTESLPNEAWRSVDSSVDVNARFRDQSFVWGNEVRVAANGSRVVIAGENLVGSASKGGGIYQIATIERASLYPTIQYLHPDAAAAGMSVVVEAYARPTEFGGFGLDGLGSGQLELDNSDDQSRIVIGPSVVSWDGRLISSMIFVKPDAKPGAVPLHIRVGNVLSNADTFFIVTPHHLGAMSGGGTIGTGMRSRRGVLVVDSLILRSGVYTIDTGDCDPRTPGNQGFLPVTILSKGPVLVNADAVLSVSAISDSVSQTTCAGPGGGGGGSGGYLSAGGSGYTGGGGSGEADTLLGSSIGSGGMHSGFTSGGGALNGVPGGMTYVDVTTSARVFAPAGGGTGHPFGASGMFGRISPAAPVESTDGAFGGGSAGIANNRPRGFPSGGGGGSNGSAGQDGFDGGGGELHNGGRVVGCRELVPIAGGSGGAGGGYSSGGTSVGGSGGGGISIVSFGTLGVQGKITANGSNGLGGISLNSSGGGGGAGGSILLASHDSISFGPGGQLSATGGRGGRAVGGDNGANGGDGGDGRLRIDGVTAAKPGSGTLVPNAYYNGPSSPSSRFLQARVDSSITGYGIPNSDILIWKKAEARPWTSYATRTDSAGRWSYKLTFADVDGGRTYFFVMQGVASPSSADFAFDPQWVMSPAAGNVIDYPRMTLAADTIQFGCHRYRTTTTKVVAIQNTAQISNLVLSNVHVEGPDAASFRVLSGNTAMVVQAGASQSVEVQFTPRDTGSFEADLVMNTNIPWIAEQRIKLYGCGISGRWGTGSMVLDLGELCPSDCIDTTITVSNAGDAPFTLERVERDTAAVDVSLLSPQPGTDIANGKSQSVRLRFCMKQFDPAGTVVRLIGDGIDSVMALTIRSTNALPHPEMPATVAFGTVDLKGSDTCVTRTILVHNLSAASVMHLGNLQSSSPVFTIVPPIPSEVAPGASAAITVKFCPGGQGEFQTVLGFTLSSGNCALDTGVALRGSASMRTARYVVIVPDNFPRTITFAPTLVSEHSPAMPVVIRNIGDGDGGPVTAMLGTMDFVLENSITGIRAGTQETLYVHMAPTKPEELFDTLHLSCSDPAFTDMVLLNGHGTERGLQVDLPVLSFGETCVGDSSDVADVLIYNNGSVPVTIMRLDGLGEPFRVVSGLPVFPHTVEPGETLRVAFKFHPTAAGSASGLLTIVNDANVQLTLPLRGIGATGHLLASVSALDFGCIPTGHDSTIKFTVTNTGACPVSITGPPVGLDSHFTLIGPVSGIVEPNGGQIHYEIRYTAGTAAASSMLEIRSSAPELISIKLNGDVCNPNDEWKLALTVDSTSAWVNDTIVVPVRATIMPGSYHGALAYTMTLKYAADLLMPRIGNRHDALHEASWEFGTVSDGVAMSEKKAGELTITGTIRAGETSGTLVNVPFKVLLGHHWDTDITIDPASLVLGASDVTPVTQPGRFHAFGCDTTGGIYLLNGYSLSVNVPNPFARTTLLRYRIGAPDRVVMNLYDAGGNLVRTIIDEAEAAGDHDYLFDAGDLPSGLYTYELISGKFRMARQMLLQH
ncbi:MAG: choice-of-anchor D domain-containing protein [Bacteroidetes bacterium]|nr:choice-of-anchor D domain-containing protein [Bacteroidota bacterium]